MSVLTPMQRQYHEIKKNYKHALLFFRLGDFYELFYEDAEIASKELGLTLTARHKKSEAQMQMCGVPHHSADKYIARLTKAGFKVAICDQISDPSLPGIVKRDVVKVITPGTTFQDEVLDTNANNYIVGIVEENNIFGIAYADITTGEFRVTEITDLENLREELTRIHPAEVLIERESFSGEELKGYLLNELQVTVGYFETKNDPYETLTKTFQVKNLECYGIENEKQMIKASGRLISYLLETQKTELKHLNKIQKFSTKTSMNLDRQTIRNLELLYTSYEGEKQGTLLNVLDQCMTSAGSRLLRRVLLQPLLEKEKIEARLETVDEIYSNSALREGTKLLKKVLDIERIMGKISCKRCNARDVLALKQCLEIIPEISAMLSIGTSKSIQAIYEHTKNEEFQKLYELLEKTIEAEPPITVREGGMIKDGYSKKLDEIKTISKGGKEWLQKYQEDEKERTGLSSLKVGFNRVFGYYIEISKGQSDKAPDDYIRKQTLTNGERYITPVLKEYEGKVLEADDKLKTMEYDIFMEICDQIIEHVVILQKLALSLAWLDVYANLAFRAIENNYAKPQIIDNGEVLIEDGRHPVIEKMLPKDQSFVPNTLQGDESNKMMLLTGPNMAGKSTYLRQNAIIVLMAQIGSFVPVKRAQMPIFDRIFTRIGASDNLSRGQSTFMVEMQELSYILHNATDKSLIILDEIGRGTSTYDGMSLAWATFEHIHNEVKAQTLFATHYHEMVDLAEKLKAATNASMAVTENSEGVVFLWKVVPGGADQSYGIEVAKLAGLPKEVIERANEVLTKLESENGDQKHVIERKTSSQKDVPKEAIDDNDQMSFLVPQVVEKVIVQGESKVEQELKKLNLDRMRPVDALMKMHEWKKTMS